MQDKKINVFGFSAVNFRLSGGGSGASDQSRSVSLFQGLENAGISYNQELYEYYSTNEVSDEKATGMGQVLQMFISGNKRVEPSIRNNFV